MTQDLRFATRMLRRRPMFALVAILTLALGIGANTAIFSVVDAVLFKPLPYPDSERLVSITHSYVNLADAAVSPPAFLDYRERNRVFAGLTALAPASLNLTGGGEPERLQGAFATAGFFDTLGVHPAQGRGFTADEDQPGRNHVVVLSDALWTRRFGADPAIIGKAITIDGEPNVVLGVMPAGFDYPRASEIWTPMAFTPAQTAAAQRNEEFLTVIARLKPGLAIEAARSDMRRIADELRPRYYDPAIHWGIAVESIRNESVRSVRATLLILLASVGVILLIACANVANLLLARAAGRQREMAVRAAIGASRGRIVRQLVTESLLLAGLGGAAGLLLATIGAGLLVRVGPANLPRLHEVGIDLRVLAFTVAASLLTGVLFGLAPAASLPIASASRVRLSARRHVSVPSLQSALRDTARGSTTRLGRLRAVLVVAEVALALVLAVAAGLLLRSFARVMAVDPGFTVERVLTMRLALPESKYPDARTRTAFFEQVMARIAATGGVEAAGAISNLPLSGSILNASFALQDHRTAPGEPALHGDPRAVTAGYFEAMKIALMRGRYVDRRDTAASPPVCVIDDEMVRRYFAGRDPVGRRLAFFFEGSPQQPVWREIVGVVHNVKHGGLDADPRMHIYYPYAQRPRGSMFIAVRTTAAPGSMLGAVRAAIRSVDPDQPIFQVRTMAERMEASMVERRFAVFLLGAFAVVGVALAAVGVYAVLAYAVLQRTAEIGIRMALGAPRTHVMGRVLAEGMGLSASGIVLGLAGSLAAARALRTLLFGIQATDPLTLVTASAVIACVGFIATAIPAWRATRVDPLVALRGE